MDCPVPLFVYRIRIAFCILPVREMRIGVNDDLECTMDYMCCGPNMKMS